MSFVVPNQVPTFNHPQRKIEDHRWGSSGSIYGRHHAGPTGPGQKIGSFFERRELPMYKDKPYNYTSASRRRRWWRKKRVLLSALFVFAALIYWLGVLVRPRDGTLRSKKGTSTMFGWLSRGRRPKIDWDERRDKVREAFILSWDAYEQYAWGASARWFIT